MDVPLHNLVSMWMSAFLLHGKNPLTGRPDHPETRQAWRGFFMSLKNLKLVRRLDFVWMDLPRECF